MERPGNTVATTQSHLPQLPFQMPDMRLPQAFEAGEPNPIAQTREPRLNIGWQRPDLPGDRLVQDFALPWYRNDISRMRLGKS